MSILNFFYPVLDALSDGRVIRKIVVWALRILAVLVLLGGLYGFVEILRMGFRSGAPADFAIGGLLLALILVGAVGCVAQILLYRADKIEGLTDSTLTVIPVVSILFRAAGEIYATLGVAVGVGGCLFIWLTRTSPFEVLRGVGRLLPLGAAGGGFVDGLAFLANLCVMAFVVLVLFYFLAECTVLWADMAQNMRLLRGHFVPSPAPAAVSPPPPAPAPAAAVIPPTPVAPPLPPTPPPAPRCPGCGAEIEAGSAFCGNCGTRLR